MASNPQASERGMASRGAMGFEVMTTGATGVVPTGWINNGWVLVMLIVGVGRGKTVGASVVASDAGQGAIWGGNRRMGATGVRVGSTMRAVSRFMMLGATAVCSGRGGSAIRTVSFFGSAMSERRAIQKIAQTGGGCHLFICSTGILPVGQIGVSPVFVGEEQPAGSPLAPQARCLCYPSR